MQRAPDIPGLRDLVQIGQGGNGVVYRAMQDSLRRVVAVKLLTTRLDPSSAERFARESQALGLMSGHPNIVPVYSADTTADGEPYFIMQLCENGSLAERVERDGPMDFREVVDLGIRMCGALQTAHDAGMLHRDIKPGNILFDSYGVPRLADFGQAQHADLNLTRTGDVVATPGFAAPEILTGQRATPRSDVYSLATTLLAALLGYSPFSRDTDEQVATVLLRVLQEPPPDVRPLGVPAPVADLLERAMSKQPADRPMKPVEFGQALQHVQRMLGLPETPMIIPPKPAREPRATAPLGGGLRERDDWGSTPQMGAAPTPPMGSPPMGSPAMSAPASAGQPKRSRRASRWIALIVGVLLIGGLGTWGAMALLDSAEPKKIDSASDLLIGGSDFGSSSWETTDDISLIAEVIGSIPDGPNEGEKTYYSETQLSKCLELDFAAQIVDAKASATYVDTSVTKVDGDAVSGYRYAKTQGLVVKSESVATKMVEAYASPRFDTCLSSAKQAGVDIGYEDELYDSVPGISVPSFDPDPPDAVHVQARQITVPLSAKGDEEEPTTNSDGKEVESGRRYVTILAMSAGTSVTYVVFQSAGAIPEETLQAAYDAFMDNATQ